MKQAFFIFFFSIFSFKCLSQNIDSVVTLQDGTIVDCSHAFLDGEMPTFRLQNGKSDNIKWAFNLYDKNEKKTKVIESKNGIDNFTFKITPDLFPIYVYNCKKIEFPNDSSLYVCGSIDLYKDGTAIDSISVLLNVLPSRPKVKETSIFGNFDYQEHGYNPCANLTISFISDRMEDCMLAYFVSDSLNNYLFPKNHSLIYDVVDKLKTGNNSYELTYNFADWGQFYTIAASNKYGGLHGDTICTTDYITDPKILSFLEMLHNQITVIDNISEENYRIVICNDAITLEGCTNMDITADIFSVNGILKSRSVSTKKIYLNHLVSGTYIVRIKINHEIITKKIIRS